LTVYIDGELRIPLLQDNEEDVRDVCNLPDEMTELIIDMASAMMDRKNDDALYRQNMADALAYAEELRAKYDSSDDIRMRHRDHGEGPDLEIGDPRLPPEFGNP